MPSIWKSTSRSRLRRILPPKRASSINHETESIIKTEHHQEKDWFGGMSFFQSDSEFDSGALAPISEEIQATTKKAGIEDLQTMAVFNESSSEEIQRQVEIAEASPVPAITLNGRPMVEEIVDSVNGENDVNKFEK